MKKYLGLFVLLLLLVSQVVAQSVTDIKISARKTPLSQVLFNLKKNYGLQFAFDSDLLSKYNITVNRTFKSEYETLTFLLKNLPLEIEKSGDVFLIIPKSQEQVEFAPEVTRISGQVLAAQTFEPLPYSYILINRKPIQSDLQGHFNFIASADTSFNIQISHLGYFVYDTIVDRSMNRKFFLTPQIERIKEVKVLSNPIEKSTLIGDMAGRMKINHQIAPILPGHGDNSVFNLLRLMPGVLASGESSNDLLIWGAYESHSKIQFDGFTVFGLKNFNDNIAVVNPFMVKNIEVLKGGYDARYGERVGGIVDIQGKDGTLLKPTFTFNINSTTLNTMLQVPLSKKSSIIGAYRQTYYQLYDPTTMTFYVGNNNTSENGNNSNSSTSIDLDVIPDFVFRDANFKYTFKGDNGSRLSMSLYGGGDDFKYDMEGQILNTLLRRRENEKNKQLGGSAQYHHSWGNGDNTNFTLAYSSLERQIFERNETENIRTNVETVTRKVETENTVDEVSFIGEHTLNFKQGHRLLIGAGAITNKVQLSRFWSDEQIMDIDNQSSRLFLYLQDELPLGKHLIVKTGVRAGYANEVGKGYFEPRASASINLFEGMKLNASWGLYNQFLAKTTVVDSSLNYTQFWTNADDLNVPVLSAEHLVGGISYNKNGFTFSAETFYKTTDGLNRYFVGNNRIGKGYYEGRARSSGIDIFLKKEYKRHMAWVSYTYCNTEENYPFYILDDWRPAPHQQKHELKFAGVFNFKSFYLSANYVYGSGFDRFDFETDEGVMLNQAYNRLDASLVYKFKPGKVNAEAGISILNVLDTENIKYSNISISYIDEINLVGVYADAVSFTPAVFLKVEF